MSVKVTARKLDIYIYIYIYMNFSRSLLTNLCNEHNLLCGLVVRVPGYRSTGPGSIPGAARFAEV
jgi:hypothetical protein